MPAIFTAASYDDQKEKASEYIGNKRSVLIGMPRLRQLRVMKSKLCFVCDYFPKVSYKSICRLLQTWNRES